MQFIKITNNTSLSELSEIVGYDNVDSVLALNGLDRTANVGKELKNLTDSAANQEIASDESSIIQKKLTLLNQCSGSSDVFTAVSSLDDKGWNVYAATGTLIDYLRVPDIVQLPNTDDVLGNSSPVQKKQYESAVSSIQNGVNPSTDLSGFDSYQAVKATSIPSSSSGTALSCFKLPFDKVCMYSYITGEKVDFPCYPSEYSDGIKANYDTMPDMLYQYEPWQVYKGSGPRQCSFSFDIHRDMWTGDHRDGKAIELIQFCEAACYARYNGAVVNAGTVGLYINGRTMIHGVMTDVTPAWDTDSPIGLDGFYLHLKLSFTIIEVAFNPRSYDTVVKDGISGYS